MEPVTEDLEIGTGVLYQWMRKDGRDCGAKWPASNFGNDILKKAAVILGTKLQTSAAR